MGDSQYDVAIVGAGPAGATAAILLAKGGHHVALVDRATFPRKASSVGWMSSACTPLVETLGLPVKLLTRDLFREVTFYSGDFTQMAKPSFQDAPGSLIDRMEFNQALLNRAVREGATFITGCAVEDFALKESATIVQLNGGRSLEARLLLLASGSESKLLERAGITVGKAGRPVWIAQVDARIEARFVPAKPKVTVVFGLDRFASFGLCCVSHRHVSIGVRWLGDRTQVIPSLVLLCNQAVEKGVVPMNLSQPAMSADLIPARLCAAIDMDTHVGKHTLVIGEAGGFVSASSHEGVYPSMWSARIAVEVAEEALHSLHSQDELMTFNTRWRTQMADYIRAPHTDIQFLLPLIFTNQPMADRMGAAFFRGENI